MTIEKAVSLGVAGNELSKVITGSSEVSLGRTVVSTGCGAAMGAAATGALVVAGVASAPVVVPLAIAAGAVSCIASWFD